MVTETTTMDRELGLALYGRMARIRSFEEALQTLMLEARLPGFVHLSIGQEAVPVGICAALEERDRIVSTHRGHGHILAKGARIPQMMAELLGRREGYCKGKGGSMHIVDSSVGVLGANGIVGGGIPMATGSALAARVQGTGDVTVCFFGDGATGQGVLYESLNLSALWNLPVIFVCEANGWSEWTPTASAVAGEIAARATPFGIPSERVDGNDVWAVRKAALAAVERARSGGGPTFVEARTYRQRGHFEGEEGLTGAYRTDDAAEEWERQDPLARLRRQLLELDVGAAELDAVEEAEREAVREGLAFAESAADPDPSEALEDLYA
jgi:pyruvate dehydrogenase E1 component alpha subunit